MRRNFYKQLVALSAILFIASPSVASNATQKYNYGDALSKSIMFYDFQKSGPLPSGTRNNWRSSSCLDDGKDVGMDLAGGLFDAGDHIKFGLPMGYSATMLAWSYLEDKDYYEKNGQAEYILGDIKWVAQYFIKCNPDANTYYYQVGHSNDHSWWVAPELIDGLDHEWWKSNNGNKMIRPSLKLVVKADSVPQFACVVAEDAATLAAAYICFKDKEPAFADSCLFHSKQLYNMSRLMGNGDEDYNKYHGGYYPSGRGDDEKGWSGCWLYKATGDKQYLLNAEKDAQGWVGGHDIWTQCWEDKRYGTNLLLAQLDSVNGAPYKTEIEWNLDFWSDGAKDGNGNVSRIEYTPKGLAYLNEWGSLRYAAAASFLACIYADWKGADPDRISIYRKFAKSQADYILGSTGRSFLVGYNETSPKNPHHRGASGIWMNGCEQAIQSRHCLMGALVGGPYKTDEYKDDRTNYICNEVSDDYNAGAVGLFSKMYRLYGGEPDPNLNDMEKIGEEYYMTAGMASQDSTSRGSYVDFSCRVFNHTAWPARYNKNMKYRVFFDISDAMARGEKASQFDVRCDYASKMTEQVSTLKPYNPGKGMYYVEVMLPDFCIYPAGEVSSYATEQIHIQAPGKWNYKNSPIWKDINGVNQNDTLVRTNTVVLYDHDKIIYGKEPECGFDSTSVADPSGGDVEDKSIQDSIPVLVYKGPLDYGDYSANVIPADSFVQAKTDKTLLLKMQASSLTPMRNQPATLTLSSGKWSLYLCDQQKLSTYGYQAKLTAVQVDALKSEGLNVNGSLFTIESIWLMPSSYDSTTGIVSNMSLENDNEVMRYNCCGQCLYGRTKGLNIIRHGNGKVTKVIER